MKVRAKNLRVREQEMRSTGHGLTLASMADKQYNVTLNAEGDDGRELHIELTEAEMVDLLERHEKQKRWNKGDFTGEQWSKK